MSLKIILSAFLMTAHAVQGGDHGLEKDSVDSRQLASPTKTGVTCGDGTSAKDCVSCGAENCEDSVDCELRNSIGAVRKITPVCAPIGGFICKTDSVKSLAAVSCQACRNKHQVCAGECMEALNANGNLMCQSPGLNEFGIMWNIRKDLCKNQGAAAAMTGKIGSKSIEATVMKVFMDSLCAPDGALDWHKTIGQVTKMWCQILSEALPMLKTIVSQRVYDITQRRWKAQCLNNSLQPSFLTMIVELILDGDILFALMEFFKRKICVKQGGNEEFFKNHQILYAMHVFLFNSTFCNVFNSQGLIQIQTFTCSLSSAHQDTNELRNMLRDGSFGRNFGMELAHVFRNVFTEKVLRHLHKSMIEKCGWSQDARTKTEEEPANAKSLSAAPSAVTTLAVFAAAYLL